MSPFAVVYDACVLYPAPLRDLLMWLALRDLFRARWTEQILDEMERSILRQRTDLAPDKIARTRKLMNQHVREALVTGHEALISSLQLPDPDDRHVLAAAIRCQAQIIVTYNLKDFPASALKPFGIEAQHPDDFLEHLLDLHRPVVLDVVRELRQNLQNPRPTAEELLQRYSAQSLVKTVEILTEFVTLL